MKKLFFTILAVACLASTATAAKKTTVKQQNPFLAPYTTKYEIPPFEKIKYEHYLPALQAGIDEQNAEFIFKVTKADARRALMTRIAVKDKPEDED